MSSSVRKTFMKKYFFLFLLSVQLVPAFANDEKPRTKAELTAVTVYRAGAEMIHAAKANLVKGNSELVIENLSNALEINSVQIKSSDNVTVMGVEFNTDYLKDDIKNPRIKMLEDSVERLSSEIERIKLNESITTDLLTVLKANKEIKGTQTGLSVAELMKLMDYYKLKSAELQLELAQLKQKKDKFSLQLQKIVNQIDEEEKKNNTSSGSLVLQLNTAVAGKYEFVITYVTNNAYWNAFYDLKATNVIAPLKLIYRAKIFQTTGIDWKQVKLSLSTSTPTQAGNAPVFKAWFLSYINPVQKYERNLSTVNTIQSFQQNFNFSNSLAGKTAGVGVMGYNYDAAGDFKSPLQIRGVKSFANSAQPLYVVNGVPMESGSIDNIDQSTIKDIQVLKDAGALAVYGARGANGVILVTLKDGLDDYISVSDRELDVTFNIDLPYDIPTNGKAQTATLKEYDVPASYKYYSVPKLDKDAFLLAEVPDWEGLNLLPGEANIIFEGTYIGKSFIDPSSTQDTINLTMGRDKRVVIKREKLKDFSSVKFLGTNKKQIFTYELTVKNNKKDEVSMLLKDQYPVSQNKEVEVELLESNGAAVNEETGVVTWKVKLAPGEVKKIRISYSVKYPKDKALNLN
jgi:TonB-dependent SusC/RagA subfamily outer membrane receptor